MINTPKIYKMRVVFTVAAAYDHKHIFSLLRTAVLKSGLPFAPAKVNPNWPRLAYGPALGQGQRSLGEYADLYFSSPVKEEEAARALEGSAPKGLCFTRVERVPYALPSVSQLAEVMQYSVEGDFDVYSPALGAEEFFAQEHVYVMQQAPNGITVQQDIKPYVFSVRRVRADRLELLLQRRGDKTVKPEHAVAAWLGLTAPAGELFTPEGLKFIREALYWRDAAGSLHAI